MTNRVVITGMGAVTPLGNSVDEFWEGLKEGKNGIGPITKFDATETGISVAGELKDFDATNYMPLKIAKRMDEFSRYGVAAAVQAVE
ncbi:MAG: beta-ketoacyl synthase N-terminal-like domain-containing protein, partial [Carnobacterium sp.]